MRYWLLYLAALPSFAHAQNVYEVQRVCWLAGQQYSPGAVILAADGPMLCSPDFVWVDTKKAPAGCLRNGQLSAVGTIAKGETKDSIQTECRPDGTWERVE
ncbi:MULTISPECIES: DUF1496 domain-containing protein [unclassified Mesorhizobium]|uniref:DUF1496 domain-containing protein n=1 Tax=unclassified Mesorhizobium TaxID=325217 RepID=UPI001CCDE9F6|nr:YnjH family protein [Mesorhizobium sp. CO1-1-2]MBZ9925004.1 YnjH family protein [Mesorhizobium sp. BR1-1-4]